ncbi:hypothetical protein GDO81_023898, partial [Engystomops pustulosus]
MNHTSPSDFQISPFFTLSADKVLIFHVFLFIYVIGLLMNILILSVIYVNDHLQVPLYIFLCNLSCIDICSITSTIPKLLAMILSGNNTISFTQCFTQTFFFLLAASAEDILLFIMAYDRYVAICNPLHYHHLLSKRICILFIFGIWVSASLNSLLMTLPVSKMSFCGSNRVQNFFCDAMDIFNASCGGSSEFNILIYAELMVFGLFPTICNVLSYGKIVRVILSIKSKEGRRKTFSTCLSHLIVMTIYYSAGSISYLALFSDRTAIMKQILSAFYVTVVPMINPLIYSLRNKDIIKACRKLLK